MLPWRVAKVRHRVEKGAKQDRLQAKPYTGRAYPTVWLICFQSQWWELDNCFKNAEATIKIENDCFLSWPNIKHSAHLMTLALPREEALWTIKSQQTSTVWVWRSHYGLTDPIQFTSWMDSTRSENRQARVINGTPTVRPASHSSPGKEKTSGRLKEEGTGDTLLIAMVLATCIGIRVRPTTKGQGEWGESKGDPESEGRKEERGRWGQGWGMRETEGDS